MTQTGRPSLGVALRQAWVGYRRRLDDELTKGGFGDRGFPDGRVLAICARTERVTISSIGRELGMTRQGASKLITSLRARGYVTVRTSRDDAREKVVRLTPRARTFLRVQQDAVRRIERELAAEYGTDALEALRRMLYVIGGDEQPRMRDYLRESRGREGAAP